MYRQVFQLLRTEHVSVDQELSMCLRILRAGVFLHVSACIESRGSINMNLLGSIARHVSACIEASIYLQISVYYEPELLSSYVCHCQ